MRGKLPKAGVVFLALFAAALFVAGGGQVVDKIYSNLYLKVDSSTGDVIQVLSVTPSYGVDSFAYECTLQTAAQVVSEDSSEIKWVSPTQTMLFTLGVTTATPTLVDSATIGVVGCTVVYSDAAEVGIEYALSSGADATLATALDSLVDIWTKETDLSDSITAVDGGTFIRLHTDFNTTNCGTWTMILESDAGAPSDSLDTATVVCTDTMVVESLAVYFNNEATLSAAMTASTTKDTLWITADDAGTPFVWVGGDSTMDHTGDTNTFVANVNGLSTMQDTFDLVQLVHDRFVYNQVYATFVLAASTDTMSGYGKSDSGYLWLYTVFDGTYHLLDSSVVDSLPLTLNVRLPDSIDIFHGLDTLFKEKLALVWRVADTASDTTMNVSHTIEANWILKDRN